MMIRISALLLLLLMIPAPLGARTRQDCDKIQNPMEFNLCLASLAPVRGSRAARGTRPPADADVPRRRTRYPARPAESDISYDPLAPKATRNGRKAMEFTVSPKR